MHAVVHINLAHGCWPWYAVCTGAYATSVLSIYGVEEGVSAQYAGSLLSAFSAFIRQQSLL